MSNEREEKRMTPDEATAFVKDVHDRLVAIGVPAGSGNEYARKVYAEAMSCYDEMEKGWYNEDMMASAMLDALDAAASVALAAAGGWEGWPKEPLARVDPNARRVLANPESEGGKAYTAIDALQDESIDKLMEIRAMRLGRVTPEGAKIQIGEYERDPRGHYEWWHARSNMYDWLSMATRRNAGYLDGLRYEADWIRAAVEKIESAAYVAKQARDMEQSIGNIVVELAKGADLDEKPGPSMFDSLFGRTESKETRHEMLMRMGRELDELRTRHNEFPYWAQNAGCEHVR